MVIGRKEISVLLLAIGALLFFGVFLLSVSSDAQTGGDCPGAEVVNTTTGTGNKQTPVFPITGTSLQITVDIEATSSDPNNALVIAQVVPEGEEFPTTSFSAEGPGTDSSIINEGPGNFFLDLLVANANYTITVEDCTGSDSPGGGGSTGAARQVNPAPAPAKSANAQAQAGNGGASAQSSRDRQKNNVVPKTTPRRPLPPTGGPFVSSSVVVTGLVVVGAGLLGLGLVRRGGRRR